MTTDNTHTARQHLFNISELATNVKKQKMRMKWGTGLQPIMQPGWIVSCSGEKVIRLGEHRAVCPPAPLGVPASHLRSDRMYVCGDYKLIVHGGPTGENHITESVGLPATKCRRLYIQTPPPPPPPPLPRPRRMQMGVWIKKKRKRKEKTEKEEKKGEEALL